MIYFSRSVPYRFSNRSQLKMKPLLLISLVLLITVNCETNVEKKITVVTPRDSYIEAYTKSHSESGPIQVKKLENRDFNAGYPAPAPNYGPPAPNYGPPAPNYGPPAPNYGPPLPYGNSYAPAPVYGPPPPQPFYGIPYGMLSILDKFKLKIDLFTIGKILLKLVIFKKIVSLIAILCLLLFIPSLKHKEESSNAGEDARKFKNEKTKAEEKLNNVTQYVLGAIDSFTKKQNESRTECSGVYCDTEDYLKKINKKISYKKLAKLYSKELQ